MQIRDNLAQDYADIYTPEVLAALAFMAGFNDEQQQLMAERIERRNARIRARRPIGFLDPNARIPGTDIRVQDARDGKFIGAEIPPDLQRQWIQGTGPAAKPDAPVRSSLRNVAYALLSGADGWMFDGEDALGQITTMSLDNQRSLKLAIARDPLFLEVAEQVAGKNRRFEPTAIPAVCFTDPEIVVAGRTPLDAKAAGIDCIEAQFPFAANGRAMTLEAGSGFLNAAERAHMAFSGMLMTLECGVRFLTDYLEGDTYFRIHREKHNLDRCRTQFKLVSDMENKWKDMERIISEEAAI